MLITFVTRKGVEVPWGDADLDPFLERGRIVVTLGVLDELKLHEEISEKDKLMRPVSAGRWEFVPVPERWYHASIWAEHREGEPDYVFSFKLESSRLIFYADTEYIGGAPEISLALPEGKL